MPSNSRRSFFRHLAKLGAVGGVGAIVAQSGCIPLPMLPIPIGGDDPRDCDQSGDDKKPTWPYAYTKLDVETVRKLGHRQFYEGDCCYGVFSAIVQSLADELGEPFASIPTDMMRYGKGGVYGYGTLCGTVNGAAAAIQLVMDEPTAAPIITELLNWYASTMLPTDVANCYAVNHEYLVDELKTDEALPQNIAGNVLCHVSVSKWCQESGYASGSEERKERCARLAGDVAAKAVELLNAVADESFTPTLTSPGEQTGCMNCHKPGLEFSGGNFTQGKMDCTTCHVDPVLVPHEW